MSTFGNYPIIQCPICKRQLHQNQSFILYIEGKHILLCPQCYDLIGKCQTCEYGHRCAFEEDNTMTHVITQTIRQGPAVIQTQVKNPALIEKHCINCRCAWDDKGTCCAGDSNVDCPHYIVISDLLR